MGELHAESLIFLISPPRSGSTLLQRMLGSHSQVFTHPEPHLLTPLYYLGYYNNVDKAPYDHINAARAMREFCQELPRGEQDYLDALRCYALTLYGRVLAPSGKTYFVDKTPAYANILPFLVKLFPQARYVVLTRHPLAVMHSVAYSFFGGDYAAAEAANPIVEKYVLAIGQFLRERSVPFTHVRYEDLVQEPEAQMRRIFSGIGVEFESQVIDYGQHKHISKSYGDPVGVEKHQRPVVDSLRTWAQDLAARPHDLRRAQAVLNKLDHADLAAWGYPLETLLAELEHVTAQKSRRPALSSYQLQRRVLLSLKKHTQRAPVARALQAVRYYCDVLLRA